MAWTGYRTHPGKSGEGMAAALALEQEPGASATREEGQNVLERRGARRNAGHAWRER